MKHPESVPTIARRLIGTRNAMGLTQASWCRLVGITPQAWSNYESVRHRINHDQALKVCKATGVSPDWIYRGLTARLPVSLATNLQTGGGPRPGAFVRAFGRKSNDISRA